MISNGLTLWFTGLTGSGKSTLAKMVHDQLAGRGMTCEVLDSGRIRQILNRSLGFTRQEIEQTLMRIGYECRLLNRNGVTAIVAAVSPYRDVRDRIRADVQRFVEIYCRCPMDVLLQRPGQDLLRRAQRGEIENVAGVNAPYEEPANPEVLCNTATDSPETCVNHILMSLQKMGYLQETTRGAYTAAEEEIIKERFRDLGYI